MASDEPAGAGNDFWTIVDAVHWIAFGTEPGQSPATVIADAGPFLLPDIIDALAARAAGNPRSWPMQGVHLNYPMWPMETLWPEDGPQPSFPAWRYRAIVKKWMRKTGLTASNLLAHAHNERARYETELKAQNEQQSALAAALAKLNFAVASSKLVVLGRPSETRDPPRSPTLRRPIPPEYIDEPRGINLDGTFGIRYDRSGWDWLHDPGPFFYDCQVAILGLRAVIPWLNLDSATRKIELVVAVRGGRPPKYDWLRLEKALWKRLEDDGAPRDGDGGQARLEQYAATLFPIDETPSESSIRVKVRDVIERFRQFLRGQ